MTDAPKLLTEAEARRIFAPHIDTEGAIKQLRERGLIAPEPVDPLREAVRAGRESAFAARGGLEAQIDAFTATLREHGATIAPASPPLTREMVREALRQCRWSDDDHFVDRFLAALTKEQS